MNVIQNDVKRFATMMFMLFVTLLLFTQSLVGQTNIAYKNATEAIRTAQNSKQYLFLLCYDEKGESLTAMENTVIAYRKKASEKTIFYKARTTDEKEKDIIEKYGITRAPLPIVLVFAPNGAITGGFPKEASIDGLKSSIVSNVVMDILKTVQEGKIALVLLQNSKTKFNNESLKAAEEFSNDSRLKGFVNIIKADPGNPKNSDFLNSSQLSKDISEATVVFIVPPRSIAGVYKGKITKDTLMAALASCGSGCGSGGCSPGVVNK
jgi:hypothetical protein